VKERPRIVLMPGNDVLSDARLLKNLATAASLGMDTVGLGVVRAGSGRELRVGDATVRVVAVPPRVGNAGAGAWWRRLREAVRPWYATESEEKTARARLSYLAREARAAEGRRARDAGRQGVVDGPAPSVSSGRLALLVGKVVVRARSELLRRRRAAELADHEASERRRSTALARARRTVRWRSELSVAIDDEIVLGRVLDELAPDIIHVHDVFMMGVAARAAGRAALAGRTVRLVYDAREYLPGLAHVPVRTVAAYCDLEREFLPDFDRVITVSEPLAELLERDHHLRARPDLVLNAPVVDPDTPDVPRVRDAAGVAEGVPLLVYGGGVNPARGVQTVIDALVELPGVHLALVVNRSSHVVLDLLAQAERLGVADRVHQVGFVPAEHVTRYFASADVGLSPLLHVINHDVALTNKFCEYLLAGIPVVTSDTPAQADLVTELGVGDVHRAGDAADLARAVRAVLERAEELRARIAADEIQRRFAWTAQAEVLRGVYAELLGGLGEAAWRPGATTVTRVSPIGRTM